MGNMANYLEEALLDHVLRDETYTAPETVYVGIADDSATDSEMEEGDLTNEITGYDGNRPSVTFTEATQEDGKGYVENEGDVEFENMPAVTVKYAFIADAETSGNILWWGALTEPKEVPEGDTLKFDPGEIQIDLD